MNSIENKHLSFESGDHIRKFAVLTFMRGGLVSVGITLIAGLLAAFYSIPVLAPFFQSLGIDLRQLRPIHTTFASAWMFLGGQAVVHRYLMDCAGAITKGDRLRLRVQVWCWLLAGLGILLTLMFRIGSGREYLGFHPSFSALILIGWFCYAWNFFRVVSSGFWSRPVYVTMWGVGTVFFVYTFLEQHAYLIPAIWSDPILDMRIQWKATGTLVGSFNLFVYGSVIYIGERISGDSRYGHSKTAYALFGVGLLNSFTNFAHHSYHLPQSSLVKWIAFVVSMLEIIIFLRVVSDLWILVQQKNGEFEATKVSFGAAKFWTAAIVGSAILISIPPLNSIIHGTYVVSGHAMGAMIGIDTMILFGALIWMLAEAFGAVGGTKELKQLRSKYLYWSIVGLNVSVALLVGWLHFSGFMTGLFRLRFAPEEVYIAPAWLDSSNAIMFAVTGVLCFGFFVAVLKTLCPLAFNKQIVRISQDLDEGSRL